MQTEEQMKEIMIPVLRKAMNDAQNAGIDLVIKVLDMFPPTSEVKVSDLKAIIEKLKEPK